MKLFIPVGIPGCGKTALINKVLKHPHLIAHSTDDIREQVHPGKDFDAALNGHVFDIFYERIFCDLYDGYDVYADSTNLQDYARARLREIATEVEAETHLLVFTNASVAVQRNLKRDRVVPPEVMVNMLGQYEKALQDIPKESYTSVIYIEGTT